MELNTRGSYEAIIQPVIDVIHQKMKGIAGAAQNNALPSLVKSYAEPLVLWSRFAVIDDRKIHLANILEDYAKNDEKANPKDLNKINVAMVRLFQKMTIRQDADTAAQERYYKCVDGFIVQSSDTSLDLIYDGLLKTEKVKPRDHPLGISSVAFAFAAILALSLHREVAPQPDLMHSNTSPYFDLSPLYGTNETATSSIRLKDGSGMLRPDSFVEKTDMLPDTVPVLLVLWNRYHNYVANQLFSRNEDNQWKDPANLSPEQRLMQDSKIFDVARSITCINFMNVAKGDFVNGLIGMPIPGPSVQLDILHDVRGITNHKTGYLSSVESYFLYSFSPFVPLSFVPTVHEQTEDPPTEQDLWRRDIGNLRRNEDGRFDDNDLAELLLNATEVKAGFPCGGAVPDWAREQEILKLKQARGANVCTLNEFRQYLGLKPLESFEQWNSKLVDIASKLYDDDINKLELYPGLLCECSTGSGFGFGYTMTWGLITDIVTRIRCDPMFTSNFNDRKLTKWGYKDCISTTNDGEESSLCFYSTGGSCGGVLPKLFQRTLPHNYAYDNIYCLFPFVVPEKSKAYLKGLPEAIQMMYKTDRPKNGNIKVLRSLKAISEVFNDPTTFASPYKENLIELTGGYGHLLGFDDLRLHDRDLMVLLFSLMPDKGAVRRIGTYFGRTAQENLKRRTSGGGTENATIDVVKDVVEATCIRWVCETIYGFNFKDSSTWQMSTLEVENARTESRELEQKMRDDFAAYYAYIFRNSEPEFGWNAKERALTASKHLREHLKRKLPRHQDDQSDTQYGFLTAIVNAWRFFKRIGEEYTLGRRLPQDSAFTFLDRMMKTSQIKPLKGLSDSGHLLDAKKRYKDDAIGEVISRGSETLDDHELEVIARQRLEEQRVIANIIGLSMVISVNFSKVCAQVIDFYLDDKYAREREALVALCRDKNSSSEEIMAYVWEAQRIGQRFGLWRNVNLTGQPRVIKQDYDYPDVTIEPGDRVFADFTFAHNDPQQVADPEKVDLNRKTNSLLGLGLHKCPVGSLIDQTMSQIIRLIFSQKGLKRAEFKNNRLKSAILHPDAAPWHSEIYFDEDSHGISHYPTRMMIKFDASNWKDEPVIYKVPKLRRLMQILGRIVCSSLVKMLLSLLILSCLLFAIMLSLADYFDVSKPEQDVSCKGPFPPPEYWKIQVFRPKWFGLFGGPAPIIYRTPPGRKAHRISVVDIDKRDIEIRMWVDDEDRGHLDVDLDPTVDCGDDVRRCLSLNFGTAAVTVPPGRHTIKAEIRMRNESHVFVWGKERQRRIKWVVQQCT